MITPRFRFLIFNFLGLEITWGACAYGAINDQEYFGVIVGGIYIFIHFLFTQSRFEDLLTLVVISAVGVTVDVVNTIYGVVAFNTYSELFLIPHWLVVLWMVFALMVPHSLLWLSRNYLLAALLGGILGSFSYWLGHKLGAIILPEPVLTNTMIYFFEWSILFPAALWVTNLALRMRKNRHLSSLDRS